MQSKVYCFASAKGGSGKTVLTATVASFLTEIGKKCLIIDCDAATHGMTLLYLTEVSNNPNLEKVGLFNSWSNKNLEELLKTSLVEVENGIYLLPATYNFTLGFDPEKKFDENALARIVKIARADFDFIFLDAQAGSDKYSVLAMDRQISDEVVIVSEYDPLSSAGVERLKRVVGDRLDYSRTWILLNKMLPEFVEKFSEFLSVTKYLPPIAWNADVVRAYAKGKLALDFTKGNVFTLSVVNSISALVDDHTNEEIKEWLENKSYALREPIEDQYQNAQAELESLHYTIAELEYKERRKKMASIYVLSITAILTISLMLFILQRLNLFKLDFTTITAPLTGILALTIVVTIQTLYLYTSKFLRSNQVNSRMLKRQINLAEEKVIQLEALKKADLETLIKKQVN